MTDVRLAGEDSILVHVSDSGRPACSALPVYRATSGPWVAFLAYLGVRAPLLPLNSAVVGDLNTTEDSTEDCLRTMSSNGFFNTIKSLTRYGDTKISL